MEEGLNRFIREKFEISQRDIRTYSPLTLAYIGDGIFDLVIRTVVVDKGNTSANQLHSGGGEMPNPTPWPRTRRYRIIAMRQDLRR